MGGGGGRKSTFASGLIDSRAPLELVVWHLENSESERSIFEVSRSPYSDPDEPFIASFEKDSWMSGKTAPLSICNSALRFLKKVRVVISENE
jgi:hypothetical protein